jgi:hypothetical protein
MRTHEFWRERETGEIWAIELVDGIVHGAQGPLRWSEINPAFLDSGYHYSAEAGADLEARREEFEPLNETTVVLISGSADC